ncbi:MAG: tripartite tricarboxylate transporter substrate binding protein, partial [Alphaproteobacteria bacterium]|nr:tripartite tricarboxylate transporter substrate binding protein [Alphaproteobacteria bacterium]
MRALVRLCLLLSMLAICGNAFAAYPDRAVRLVVPFPPGGPVDLVAHIIAPKLGQRLGQQVT